MHHRAGELLSLLALQPHPDEGGWYLEIYRSADLVARDGTSRPALTTIDYQLVAGQLSRWHVVPLDDDEQGAAMSSPSARRRRGARRVPRRA